MTAVTKEPLGVTQVCYDLRMVSSTCSRVMVSELSSEKIYLGKTIAKNENILLVPSQASTTDIPYPEISVEYNTLICTS